MENCLKFMEVIGNLKHLKRTGWVLSKVQDCETVSSHMYRMAMMSFFLEDCHGLDRTRVMEMSKHDLAEAIVGDITPYCGVPREEKILREFSAMNYFYQP